MLGGGTDGSTNTEQFLTNPKSESKSKLDDWVFIKIKFSKWPATQKGFKEARWNNLYETLKPRLRC